MFSYFAKKEPVQITIPASNLPLSATPCSRQCVLSCQGEASFLECDLEIRHGVDLGQKYLNDHGCATFVHFIAEDLREQLLSALSKAHFFSIQVDGTTDAGNVEEELFLVVYFQPNYTDGKVHVCNQFFSTRQPRSATGEGLYEYLQRALDFVGVKNWKSRLIGLGCDGAAANMSVARGMHHFLKEAVPWVAVSWCLAHRLELSIKDALKSTFFTKIDELLLQVYFMYEKSPKKCRELKDVAEQLRACLEDAADNPKSSSAACFWHTFCFTQISALARLIDCYGVYINHFTTLSQQESRGVERQRLHGYVLKWSKTKLLLGCAVFYDILKPVAVLSKALQEQDLCTVRAIDAVLKAKDALVKLHTTAFEDMPTVKKVLSRVQTEDSGNRTYQSTELKEHDRSVELFRALYNYLKFAKEV